MRWGGPVYSRPMSAPSPRERLKQATDLLDDFYGRPVLSPRYPPVDELVFTVLSQNTADVNTERTFAVAEGAVPGLDVGARRVRRGDRGGHRARRPRAHQGAAHQEDPRGHQRADRRARAGRAGRDERRGGAGVPRRAARRRAQDGRVRAAVRARPAGDAGGHARPPGRPAPRHHRREGHGRPGAPAAHRAGRRRTTPSRCTPCTWTSCGTAAASATPGGRPAASARSRRCARRPGSPDARRGTARRSPAPRRTARGQGVYALRGASLYLVPSLAPHRRCHQ